MPWKFNPLNGEFDFVVPPASAAWGGIVGTLSSQTDLQTALDGKVNKAATANRIYGTDNASAQTTYSVAALSSAGDTIVRRTGVGEIVTATPTATTHATTKAYVDTADALKVSKAGDTMTGRLENSSASLLGYGQTRGGSQVIFGSDGNGRFHVYNNTSALAVLTADSTGIALGFWDTAAPRIVKGTGFPDGVISAPVGSIYIDTAVTSGASSWIKKSGAGNTGWQVLEGDTGWRNIGNITGITEQIKIRRVGSNVYFSQIGDGITINSVVTLSRLALPLGFRSSLRQVSELIATSGAKYGTMLVKSTETDLILTTTGTASFIAFGNGSFVTDESYPTTLPGTAV